jgi:integrase
MNRTKQNTTRPARSARRAWSYKAGERGRNRVRAYRDQKTGGLFVEWYERGLGEAAAKRVRIAIRSDDERDAKRKADEMAAAFGSEAAVKREDVTLEVLFDNYIAETAPHKGESKRDHDRRAAEMFLRFLGPRTKAKDLSKLQWDRFIVARRRGEITTKHVQHARPVGNRVVEYDLSWLRAVFNWATLSGSDTRKGVLLDRNPLRGLPIPKNESPKRAVLTEAQYDAMLIACGAVSPAARLALVVAHETGHRIGAIRQLRWSDVDLEASRVRWRPEQDKTGFGHTTPLTDEAREALRTAREQRRDDRDGWVFPAPSDPTQPCSRHLLRDWWERAADKAKLPKGERYGWHSLRRKFATELENAGLKTLQDLGGWKSHHTILQCYLRPDEDRQREALTARKQARAAR